MKKWQQNLIAALLAFLFVLLQSPKWTFAPAAWVAPILVLWLVRNNKWWKGVLWAFVAVFPGAYLGNTGVIPFPLPVMIVVLSMGVMVSLLPYLLDKWLNKGSVLSTLIFPSAYLLIEYFNAQSPSGVWTSMANTQYAFQPFIQIASIFGLLGITFMITWLAPVTLLVYERWQKGESIKVPVVLYSMFFIACNVYGGVRLGLTPAAEKNQYAQVATITMPVMDLYEKAYSVVEGKEVHLPADISVTSQEMANAGMAFQEFLSNHKSEKFGPVLQVMEQQNDKAFEMSQEKVEAGAGIVVWSEGLGKTFLEDEDKLISKAREFAGKNNVYLVMAMASFFGGEIKPGELSFENKVLTIGPDGEILNTFFKNMPIPYVESSVPGDGSIPVIDTKYGGISPSICYDADFPALLSQTGKNNTGLLLIPTGDWANIAPYHSYMTRFRAIENGCTVVKAVSNGLSIAYDPMGRELGRSDFFTAEDQSMLVDAPVYSVATPFPYLHSLLPVFALALVLGLMVGRLIEKFRTRKNQSNLATA